MTKLWLVVVVLAACGGGSKIPSRDGAVGGDGGSGDGGGGDGGMLDAGPGMLTISPPTRDFGTVDVGLSSMVDLAVRNEGGTALGVLTVTPPTDASFVVNTDGCNGHALDPAGLCTIRVRFAPTAFGPRAGTLSVSAAGGGTVSVPMMGIGRDVVTLSIVQPFGGNGLGTVTGGGLTCPGTCSVVIPRIATAAPSVTLTAAPDISSTLTWGGACSGSSPTCTLSLNGATSVSVSATFTKKRFTLTASSALTGGGTGTLVSAAAGVNCTGACSQTAMYDYGTVVTLTATPTGASYVKAWTGDCSTLSSKCMVTMTQDRSAGVTFNRELNNFWFVTSTKVAPGSLAGMDPMGTGDGLRGGDAVCQRAAVEAGLGGTYQAFLSTASTNAVNRMIGPRGWVRRDGRPFADTVNSLFVNAHVYYPPSLDEHGVAVGGVADVATGTLRSGMAAPSTCTGWTSMTGQAALGSSKHGGDAWTDFTVATANSCTTPYRLYCYGTNLSAPLSFTPATGRIAFLANQTFNGATGVAGADQVCNNDAGSAGLTGTYRAFIGTTAASPGSRFTTTGMPWVRPDGVALVANAADMFSGPGQMLAALNIEADGTSRGLVFAWMGSTTPLTTGSADETCNSWGDGGNVMHGIAARSNLSTNGGSDAFLCNLQWRVFCLQQ